MEMARFLAIFLIVFAHTASAQTETQARAAGTNVSLTESSGIKSPASGDDHEQSDGDPGSRKGGRGAQCDR
jgi:hypothetical protein